MSERGTFASKIGVILAAAGSAVGLGNIWRFPTEAGSYGGSTFIIIYIACILVFGLPIMLAEFMIGRSARANSVGAYRVLAPGTPWVWLGRLTVWIPTLILCYYNVVAGWTLNYATHAAIGHFDVLAQSGDGTVYAQYFADFTASWWKQIVYLIAFMSLTHYIVTKGVNKGIERMSKLLMPGLFAIMLVLAICALQMPGAEQALTFLFKPDFSKITAGVVLAALAQAFYSLSLAMGGLTTYASYFSKDTNLGRSALSVGGVDLFVSIMAGIVIFPAVFSVIGLSPDAGASLIFVTLPQVFQTAFGSVPGLPMIFSTAFYLLLVFATVTSTVSLHEAATAYFHEEYKISRRRAATYVSLFTCILGCLCALSFGPLKEATLLGMTWFELFDYITAKWLLPIAGMLISIFAGWRLTRAQQIAQLTNEGTLRFPLIGILRFLLRYFCPTAIAVIFFNELGVFKLLGLS